LFAHLLLMKRILVIEDDESLQEIYTLILENAGYSVEVIGRGTPILENKFEIPNLFLLDKQLSGIDGLDICRFLKRQSNTSHIPVIMVSANHGIGVSSTEAGADGFMEKPFDITKLLKLISDKII
jgi:DNA-binding response OmpR family regulator